MAAGVRIGYGLGMVVAESTSNRRYRYKHRADREISDEIDSCEMLLKTNGIPPVRREILAGYGKISVEGSHLDHAVQVLVDDGFEATIFSD